MPPRDRVSGSLTASAGNGGAVAVVLAAGQSSRMGRAKPLLDLDGLPLVRHVALRAREAGFDGVVVVAAEPAAAFQRALEGVDAVLQLNERAREGMSTSIAAGLDALPAATGWMALLLADQPFVPAAHLRELRQRAVPPYLAVASRYDGTVGVPAIFAREVFPHLAALTADRGCKAILRQFAARTLLLDCPEAGFDLDTPADYERARAATLL